MKLANGTEAETHGMADMETGRFSIEASKKAFTILIDGLYTNKISAVIRELWTNAFDSHIMAGMESIPFDCHLPSLMDPTFRVRDYGVSLEHADVMGLYTTLFGSTKADTNDQVGALGLGSKSPFAYTDTFTVIARLNGEKRTYVATFAGQAPSITRVSTEQVDEAQGLEVIIPVRGEDFQKFAHEARTLAVGFDPLPQVDGLEIQPPEAVYVAQDGSYAVFPPNTIPGGVQLAIRQGCVIYPVSDYTLTQPIRNIMAREYCIVIDVPIGEVEMTASREALSLDERTKTNVTQAVAACVKHVQDEVYREADKCLTMFDAKTFWYGGGRVQSATSRLHEAFTFTPKWKGKSVDRVIRLEGVDDIAKGIAGKKMKQGPIDIRAFDFDSRAELRFVTRYDDRKAARATLRYREYVDSYQRERYTFLLTNPEPKLLKALKDQLRLDDKQIMWIGDLPDPRPPVRAKRQSGQAGMVGVNRVTSYDSWHRVEDIPDNDYLWIQVDRISRDAIRSVMDTRAVLMNCGMPDMPIYAFTEGAAKRYKPQGTKADVAMTAWLALNKKNMLDELRTFYYAQEIRRAKLTAFIPVKSCEDARRHHIERAIHRGMPDHETMMKDVAALTKDLRKKYPLLFDSLDTEAVRWYIESRDNEAAKAAPNTQGKTQP